jgi:hypothetical protein
MRVPFSKARVFGRDLWILQLIPPNKRVGMRKSLAPAWLAVLSCRMVKHTRATQCSEQLVDKSMILLTRRCGTIVTKEQISEATK